MKIILVLKVLKMTKALEKLNIIKHLSMVINEQQKIISSHFDFK